MPADWQLGQPFNKEDWKQRHQGIPYKADTSADTSLDYQALIDALSADDAGSRGFAPDAYSVTQAGIAQQAQDAQNLAKLQAQLGAEEGAREFERQKELQRMQQEYEAKLRREQMLQERESEYANLLGKGDSVRAVLLGLGLGGTLTPGGSKYEGLGAIQGAEELRGKTQQALSGLQRKATGYGADVRIGEQGVTGLGSAEQFAKTSQRGGEGIQQLLSSAFGVGSRAEGMGGGMSAEELQRRIQAVTPTGIL